MGLAASRGSGAEEGAARGATREAACARPPASAALLIGRAAQAHPLASPLVTGPGRPSRGRAEGWAGPAFPTRRLGPGTTVAQSLVAFCGPWCEEDGS